MLSNYLNPQLIKLNVDAADWRQAIQLGGNLLVTANLVEPGYVDAMVKAVEKMGPYMVLAPGLALAHARPEDGVKEMCISVITLSTPVEFGSETNDPVELVISFGGVDKKRHISMLQDLAKFLSDTANQELLKAATSTEAVIKAFETN